MKCDVCHGAGILPEYDEHQKQILGLVPCHECGGFGETSCCGDLPCPTGLPATGSFDR